MKELIYITSFGATVNIHLGMKWFLNDGYDVKVFDRNK